VVAVRESWLIEDRWWTERPLRRRYWELVTVDGRDLVVFRDLREGGWYGTGESAPSQGRPARPARAGAGRPGIDHAVVRAGAGRRDPAAGV